MHADCEAWRGSPPNARLKAGGSVGYMDGYRWHPDGCLLHSFDRNDTLRCLASVGVRKITLIGDSMIRGMEDALEWLLVKQYFYQFTGRSAPPVPPERHLVMANFGMMFMEAHCPNLACVRGELDGALSRLGHGQPLLNNVSYSRHTRRIFLASSAILGFRQSGNSLQRSREMSWEAEHQLAVRQPGWVTLDLFNISLTRPELGPDGMHYLRLVNVQAWTTLLTWLCSDHGGAPRRHESAHHKPDHKLAP